MEIQKNICPVALMCCVVVVDVRIERKQFLGVRVPPPEEEERDVIGKGNCMHTFVKAGFGIAQNEKAGFKQIPILFFSNILLLFPLHFTPRSSSTGCGTLQANIVCNLLGPGCANLPTPVPLS